MTHGKALDGFEDDMERSDALRRFHDLLNALEPIPRSNDDPAVIPVKKIKPVANFSFDTDWVCSSCGCVLGDFDSNRGYSQAHCEYCPDCGKRINWPAVSGHILRMRSFIDAAALNGILDDMKKSENAAESNLADYLGASYLGKEQDYGVSVMASVPILKTAMTPAFVDYMDDDGNMKGELMDGKHDEYQCPVCGWFVDSHEFPFLYELGEMGRKKPCRTCMACGQKIDWEGIALNPEKYQTDF